MAELPREDAVCPHCKGDDPFTIPDVGLKIIYEPRIGDSKLIITLSRRAWEVEMMEHLRTDHHRQWKETIAAVAAEAARLRSEVNARARDPLADRAERHTESGL